MCTRKSDVWSFGCVLLEMLNQGNFLYEVDRGGYVRVGKKFRMPADVSPELASVIHACI